MVWVVVDVSTVVAVAAAYVFWLCSCSCPVWLVIEDGVVWERELSVLIWLVTRSEGCVRGLSVVIESIRRDRFVIVVTNEWIMLCISLSCRAMVGSNPWAGDWAALLVAVA